MKELELRYKELEKKGMILSDSLQDDLIRLGALNFKGEYYLEDLLKIIPFIHKSWFFEMHYDMHNACVVRLKNGALSSEEIIAEDKTFVNAAGKFIIKAIERGFVSSKWEDFLKKGLENTEYYCRANIKNDERNWIKSTFEKIMFKHSLAYRLKTNLRQKLRKLFRK